MSRKGNIRWVSPVGDRAHRGGGVARAVGVLKDAKLVDGEYLSLFDLSFFGQLRQALVDVYRDRYRGLVVHSFLSPYTLVLFLIPKKLQMVVLPHGELKQGALSVKNIKKNAVIFLIRCLCKLSTKKNITIAATNLEEIDLASSFLGQCESFLVPDLVSKNLLLADRCKIKKTSGLNIVNIARMTKDKGIGDFLDLVSAHYSKKNQVKWLNEVDSITIFYIEEDLIEFSRVHRLACSIEAISSIKIELYKEFNDTDMTGVLSSIPNKLPFITSRFESFSYALIEQLNFEYKPIVWFDNELVRDLVKRGACVNLNYGSLTTSEGSVPVHESVNGQAELFLDASEAFCLKEYKKIFELGLDGS